jgi:hypothetical protein
MHWITVCNSIRENWGVTGKLSTKHKEGNI